jgi:hypothetical protein
LQAQQDSITREMAELRKQSSAAGKGKQAVDAKLHELQGELDMVNARKNLLDTMTEFAVWADPESRRCPCPQVANRCHRGDRTGCEHRRRFRGRPRNAVARTGLEHRATGRE